MKNNGFTLIELLAMIIVLGILIIMLTGCNYTLFDTKWSYDKIICDYNGNKFELKIDKWHDYDGEQLQVTSNGKTYLLSANNCYMIDD